MKNYDAAVIGGGLAGLIVAIDLAEGGRSVAVLERSDRMGGRAITVNKNGALFNLGGHALYRGGEAYQILHSYGLKLSGKKPSVKGLAIWGDKVMPMPGDAAGMLSSPLLTWSGKMELMGLMLKIYKTHADQLPLMSLRDWAEKEIRDPMVRHVFYSLCRTSTYVHDPDYQSAGPVLLQVQRALKSGVLYLDGGWQTIVEQLREKAIRLGVDLLANKNVVEIQQEEGCVRRLRFADDSTLSISHVISTLSPSDTFRLTRGAEHTVLRRWKDEARPAMAACLDLGLRRLPVPDRNFALGIDQPVFFTNHSRAAKLSDNGTLVIHLMKYNGPGESDPKADLSLLEQTMTRLHPGWEQEVVARQYLPNIAVVHDYVHLGRSVPSIGPSVPEIQGLYVAGDWVSHGEMLADAAAASGRRAAREMMQNLVTREPAVLAAR
ncbi:dehydrogenase [Cohnella kolymensis]|uniref:4,4'-diaponeurosporene oxygenase n=1 Tax=Cohnella kolymensis TaxID=1590652 RepID=A0ABR5A5Y4_9BACL|nr:FAD-dependent oxidoreductase [Cohnella kolymensis]KIL36464.1 dehydrogenase [Cohnella kolymensis]